MSKKEITTEEMEIGKIIWFTDYLSKDNSAKKGVILDPGLCYNSFYKIEGPDQETYLILKTAVFETEEECLEFLNFMSDEDYFY